MTDRPTAHVHNPVLALDAARRVRDLPPEARQLLADILRDIGQDARVRAENSWKRNKGPMAAYWKAVGAYCTHIYRAVRP